MTQQRDAAWVKLATPAQIETAFNNQELDEYMRGTQDPARVALIDGLPAQADDPVHKGISELEEVTSDELTAEAQRILDEAGPVQRDADWLKTATPAQIAEAHGKGELADLLKG